MKPDLNRISPPVSSTRHGTMKIHQLCNVCKEQLQNWSVALPKSESFMSDISSWHSINVGGSWQPAEEPHERANLKYMDMAKNVNLDKQVDSLLKSWRAAPLINHTPLRSASGYKFRKSGMVRTDESQKQGQTTGFSPSMGTFRNMWGHAGYKRVINKTTGNPERQTHVGVVLGEEGTWRINVHPFHC